MISDDTMAIPANRRSPDDALSDDALDSFSNPIMLPPPELGNLPEVEQLIRVASASQVGRDALSKFVIRDDYIMKLLPLVNDAEDLESHSDLHRLCNIMKSLILLNDNTIIEQVVSDHIVSGVVGALECTSYHIDCLVWTFGDVAYSSR